MKLPRLRLKQRLERRMKCQEETCVICISFSLSADIAFDLEIDRNENECTLDKSVIDGLKKNVPPTLEVPRAECSTSPRALAFTMKKLS